MLARLLESPKAWGPLSAVAVLAFFYFLVNFGAAGDPVANTRGLPVAVVNGDAGAEVGGRRVDFGAEVVEAATTSPRISDDVKWTHLDGRMQALDGIARGAYDGALVIPEDYSEKVVGLFGPVSDGGAEPARVEILTNPSAGPFPSGTVQQILNGVARGASETVRGRVIGELAARSERVPPELAAVLGEPVVAKVTDAQPIGGRSGRGLMPFFLMFTASILGFIGANAVNGGVEGLAGAIAERGGGRSSRPELFVAKAILGASLALVIGAIEAAVAFGIYGVHHEANPLYASLFLAFVALVSMLAALVLLAAFGPRIGVLAGSFLVISLGLATSGGTTPREMLPDPYRALSGVLPFEHATEGARALLYYDGRLDAGLAGALWVLGAYSLGAVVLGAVLSVAQELLLRRRGLRRGARLEGGPPEKAAAEGVTPGRG